MEPSKKIGYIKTSALKEGGFQFENLIIEQLKIRTFLGHERGDET